MMRLPSLEVITVICRVVTRPTKAVLGPTLTLKDPVHYVVMWSCTVLSQEEMGIDRASHLATAFTQGPGWQDANTRPKTKQTNVFITISLSFKLSLQ